MRNRSLFATFFVALLFLSACGSDADDTTASDDLDAAEVVSEAEAEAVEEDDEAAAAASTCPATTGSFETVDGASLAPTNALAARLLEGQAYTIYLTDRPISADEVSFVSGPTAEVGEVIVTMAITTFNADGPVDPVVAGESIEYTPDFGVRTFVVTADVGGTLLGDSTDGQGTLMVSQVDGRLCGEVTYSDGQKSLTAVIDAEITDI